MKLAVVLIDDDFYSLEDLKYILASFFNIEIKATFNNALDAIAYLVEFGPVDIVFCDIRMPKVNGLEGGHSLVNLCTSFVYTTGHPQYTEEALSIGAEAYLVKPVKKEAIKAVIDKVAELIIVEQEEAMLVGYIFIKESLESTIRQVAVKDILRVLANGNYINVIIQGECLLSLDKLDRVEEMYCGLGGAFIRIHRSAIAAKLAIKEFKGRKVFFIDGAEHNVGDKYLPSFRDYYKNRSFK